MTFTDFNDDDPDVQLGIPEEYRQRTYLSEAINRAHKIRGELRGEVGGQLAEFVTHMQDIAAAAAAELLVSHPGDEAKIFKLQKDVAAYAHVMAWIRENLSAGDASEMELNDIQERDQEAEHGD